jgi:hypothetical protein
VISRSRQLAALCASACLASAVLAGPAFGVGAAPAWSPVAATGPTVIPAQQSEVQQLYVDAEGGTFTLSYGVGGPGISETGNLDFNVPASGGVGPTASLQNALNALTNVNTGSGSVTVLGGPGNHNAENPYTIAFAGALANANVAQLAPNGSLLSGGQGASVLTTTAGGIGTSTLALYLQNIGGAASAGAITYKATLPSGFATVGPPQAAEGTEWNCGESTPTVIKCTSSTAVKPSLTAEPIQAVIAATPGTESGTVQIEVSGGNAPTATAKLPLTVSATPAEPGIQSFTAGAYDDNGAFDTRAGGHPYSAATAIFANTVRTFRGAVRPAGELKDITVELPPGFLGNPIAVPACSEVLNKAEFCPLDSMVGVVEPLISQFGIKGLATAVFNTEAPFGYPAKFRFEIVNVEPLNVTGTLRSDGDYGLDAASLNTPQIKAVFGAFFTFWGEPAATSHDSARCSRSITNEIGCGPSDVATDPKFTNHNPAFLTNATNCAEQASIAAANDGLLPTNLNVTLWQNPGEVFSSVAGIPPVTGCEELEFGTPEEPVNFTFEPSETKSDSTASFRTSLTVPSEGLTNPGKLMTPEIKDSVVTLPKGVVLNASGADGLEACSEQQIGLKNEIDPATGLPIPLAMPNPIRFNKDPNSCPEASKIGTGELKTALLSDPLKGNLYLAAQGKGNPFGSLFAIYLVIEDPRHGIFIKLPGKVDPSEADGQMEVTFDNLPQLPFTKLDLTLKGGNRSALASPSTCGTFVTTATNTPWSAPESGPPTESSNGFEINQGPNGLPCAPTLQERPFDLGWKAGSDSAQAGASGPFSFQITRPDGSQELESLELSTPQGLAASLKGIPYCSQAEIAQIEGSTGKAEQEHPACPAASQVGSAVTGSGSGPAPFYVGGKLYLSGPYKGAPISVVAVTPAVAGPFDLGNVVVRSAVFVNRQTAQVSAKTDPIPQILKGVVLRIRDVRIFLSHKDWTLNPTSCEPLSVDLSAHGNSGAVANKTTSFQVAGCKDLAFKPKFSAKVIGGTKRNDHPAFSATVTYPEGPGYANIKDVQVALPHSEFLDQSHINTVCTRAQATAHECPAGSIYGYAEATTPLLDGVLTGPVFLKSSVHKLPDLAIALKGPDNQPIEVEFAGRIDSVHGQIRNTIEGLPDVPVSKFVLNMKGGKKGLLVNSRDLCQGRPGRMTVNMVGQNNKRFDTRPKLGNGCKAHKAHKKHKKHKRLSEFLGGW